jgi:hypothetical protein
MQMRKIRNVGEGINGPAHGDSVVPDHRAVIQRSQWFLKTGEIEEVTGGGRGSGPAGWGGIKG